MDIEYTFWQMLHLCTSPKVSGWMKSFIMYYLVPDDVISIFCMSNRTIHADTNIPSITSQTKNQWARDDPAFVVICSLLLLVSSIAYCAAYDHSAGHAVFVVISVFLFHFLVIGALLATCCWFFTNNYLREEALNSHVVEQRVEWLYSFDVHCNSFFPMFVLLYVIHYFLSPLLVAHGFVPLLLSNLMFMVAASYYHYLNYLGYDGVTFPGEDHIVPVSNWCFLCPFPYTNSKWLQPIETCDEYVFQSIDIDATNTTKAATETTENPLKMREQVDSRFRFEYRGKEGWFVLGS
ncbi:hypothetical protein CASFOL_004749 [Castilleja foliolosa]|uniref:UNC-50 family protein n=1 Tax=Castilleja foliolosa TaxID=1961234 RepID=A0ABD3EBT4_9LAMI